MSVNTPSRPNSLSMSGSSLYTSPSGSGQAAAPSRMEQLYNTAVQSFVRRDHVQAHAALGELLGMVRASHAKAQAQAQEGQGTRAWWELEPDLSGSVRPSGVDETDTADTADTMDTVDAEWTVKILKLYISACASTYADPPSQPDALPPTIRGLLPPKPADRILCHARDVCGSFYPESDNASASPARSSFADPLDPSAAPTPTSTALLPPPLISTLVLASLKLAPPALSFAHSTAEAWLAALPDAFVMHIGPASPLLRPSTAGFLSAAERRRLEGAREGYVRVVELFVGEVLGREEEWEMARGVLDGESVMSSKRKESLYKHLRALRSRPRSKPSSPASSGVLPSPSSSGVLPPRSQLGLNGPASGSGQHARSRSSSASSSSSERTARPVTAPHGAPLTPVGPRKKAPSANGVSAKGKAKALVDDEKHATASTSTASSMPSKIWVNHPRPGPAHDAPDRASAKGKGRLGSYSENVVSRANQTVQAIFGLLPPTIQQRLLALTQSPWMSLALPLPLIAIVVAIITIRRRLTRRATTVVKSTVAAAGSGPALEAVRERMDALRARGFAQWIWWYLRWWLRKFAGVWKLGTTVTYM